MGRGRLASSLRAASPAFLWGFLVSVAYWPGIQPAAWLPRWGIIMLGLALFIPSLRTLDWRIAILGVSGVGWAAITLRWAPSVLTGVGDFIWLVALMGTMFVSANLRMKQVEHILVGFAYGIVLSALFAVAQLAGWEGLPQIGNPSGLFFNVDIYAETAAPILVWLVATGRLELALFALLPLIACQSRVSILATILGLGWWWWNGKHWRMGVVLGVLVLVAGVMIILGAPDKLASAGSRYNGWHNGAILWNPWGFGIGFFHSIVPFAQLIHSDLIQMADELGAGIFLFVLIPLVMGWNAWNNGTLWSPAWAAFACLLLESVISFPFHLPATGFLGAVLAGHLACRRGVVHRLYDYGGIRDERLRHAGHLG